MSHAEVVGVDTVYTDTECKTFLQCGTAVSADTRVKLLHSLWVHGYLGLPREINMATFVHLKVDRVVMCGEFIMRDGLCYLREIDDPTDEQEDIALIFPPFQADHTLSLRNFYTYMVTNAGKVTHPITRAEFTREMLEFVAHLHRLFFNSHLGPVLFRGMCNLCQPDLVFHDTQAMQCMIQYDLDVYGNLHAIYRDTFFPAVDVYRKCGNGEYFDRLFTMVDWHHQEDADEKANGRNRPTNTGPYVAKVLITKAWQENKLFYEQSKELHGARCVECFVMSGIPWSQMNDFILPCLQLGAPLIDVDDICHELTMLL